MRDVRHWKPRYIVDRMSVAFDQRVHPNDPWLTRKAISLLEDLLQPDDDALEFGSGRSTLWLANRVRSVVSVEDDPHWFKEVSNRLSASDRTNVVQVLEDDHHVLQGGAGSRYAAVPLRYPNATFDVILIDGIARAACAANALDKLRAGGILVLDNVERFLSSNSRSPYAIPPQAQAPPEWESFRTTTAHWRGMWTTNGVWDTALWFKP